MKKIIYTIILVAAIFVTSSASAATSVTFSPLSASAAPGESFNVIINVTPFGDRNYTVKTEVEYPTDLLEVKSFSFGNSWMPLSQSGYDLIDNENGLLIKTAGYPGGISSTAVFGTISFLAKKAGIGAITIGDNSLALDSSNENVFNNVLSRASVIIKAKKVVPVVPSPGDDSSVGEDVIAPEEPGEGEGEVISLAQKEVSFLAAVGNILSFGTGNFWLLLLMCGFILTATIFSLSLRRKAFGSKGK